MKKCFVASREADKLFCSAVYCGFGLFVVGKSNFFAVQIAVDVRKILQRIPCVIDFFSAAFARWLYGENRMSETYSQPTRNATSSNKSFMFLVIFLPFAVCSCRNCRMFCVVVLLSTSALTLLVCAVFRFILFRQKKSCYKTSNRRSLLCCGKPFLPNALDVSVGIRFLRQISLNT